MSTARPAIVAGGLALGALILANSALFSVSETQQAITFQFGQPQRFFNTDGTDPGLKAMIPFVQQRFIYDRRILDLAPSGKSEIVTADQERLEVDSFARWRITNPLRFYQAVRTQDRARERLTGLLEASLRRVLGSTKAGDIISGRRAALMASIRTELNREAGALGSRYSLHLNARVNHSFQVKNLLKLVRKLYFMLREASFVQVINCNHNFL